MREDHTTRVLSWTSQQMEHQSRIIEEQQGDESCVESAMACVVRVSMDGWY